MRCKICKLFIFNCVCGPMTKIILFLFILLIPNIASATTYYVRVSGGTSSQCTGTTNSDYGGSGTAQPCAFNHPAWVMGAGSNDNNVFTTAKWTGGDTMIIDSSNSAQYMIGLGMPNTVQCSANFPYDCRLANIPSGTVSSPTRILGSDYTAGCATKPQLWGTQGNNQIFKIINASNVDLECLELTDHSNCGYPVGATGCSRAWGSSSVGTYGMRGIVGVRIANLTLKNLDVHGFAKTGLEIGDLSGVALLTHVNIDGNYFDGFDGDDIQNGGTGAVNAGILNMDYVKIRFSGCEETYPRSASFTTNDYSKCIDQNVGGQGDAFGSNTVLGGSINITNSEISHNTQDGLDFLYCKGCQNINLDKNLLEGNVGNQLKFTGKNVNITNNIIIDNCTYLASTGKVWNTGSFASCRGNGGIAMTPNVPGSVWKIYNNTVISAIGSGGSSAFEINDSVYGQCNGTETYTFKNNVMKSSTNGSNGTQWVTYYNGISNGCRAAFTALTSDHSDSYGFQDTPSGTGNSSSDPLFTSSISNTASTNATAITLQSGSPAKGTGASGVSFWNTSADYNKFPQNSPVDMGALQYGTSAQLQQSGQSCVAGPDCSGGVCTNFTCNGSCTATGGACASGATCCTGTCTASVCAVAGACGDGTVQANLGEVCDGSNLDGSNCIQQGFTAGTLACASNCQSFNTASCTSSVVFPSTPILDSFTRSNSTGISNASWTNILGSMNISSNAALPVLGSNGYDAYYWAPTVFGGDQEVFVTISTKGSNGDDVGLFARWNPTTDSGYKLEPDVAGGTISLYKHTSGASAIVGAAITQAFSSGDSIGMSLLSGTCTIYYKASAGSWASKGTRDCSTFTSAGNIALSSYTGAGATPDIKFTNFGGGTINPIACGNGRKENLEACDGADLGGQTCITQGFTSGTLSCATDCNSFVTTSCVTATVCGNNSQEIGEICDGPDLNSATCASLGFASGSLACNSTCSAYNTTGCVSSASSATGGVIFR